VNYNVWLPPNATIPAIEAKLIANGANMAGQMPGVCAEPLMQYMCSVAYPRVESIANVGK
jgi:hypothetical protein